MDERPHKLQQQLAGCPPSCCILGDSVCQVHIGTLLRYVPVLLCLCDVVSCTVGRIGFSLQSRGHRCRLAWGNPSFLAPFNPQRCTRHRRCFLSSTSSIRSCQLIVQRAAHSSSVCAHSSENLRRLRSRRHRRRVCHPCPSLPCCRNAS